MAIEYGVFIVKRSRCETTDAEPCGLINGTYTNSEGFTCVQNGSEPLVHALPRIEPSG